MTATPRPQSACLTSNTADQSRTSVKAKLHHTALCESFPNHPGQVHMYGTHFLWDLFILSYQTSVKVLFINTAESSYASNSHVTGISHDIPLTKLPVF